MAKNDSQSLTQRIGGNRTIVLGIIIVMLVLFTVETYITPAMGVGGRGSEFVKFTVNGRTVVYGIQQYQNLYADWAKFQSGQSLATGRGRGGSREEFYEDLMVAELARDAGLAITDETLKEFIRTHPLFSGTAGSFDAKTFEEAREKYFGGLAIRSFEVEARRFILVDHYTKIYAHSFLAITDGECWQRWKGDHPRVEIACAWQPVEPLRDAMKVGDLKEEEIETFWKDPAVQNRHMKPTLHAFEAAWVAPDGVTEEGYQAGLAAWKDDPALRVTDDEGKEYFRGAIRYDFNIGMQDEATVEALRKENLKPADPKKDEPKKDEPKKDEPKKDEPKSDEPKKDAPPPAPSPEDDPAAAAAALDPTPPAEQDETLQYLNFWEHRCKKELFLKRLLTRVHGEVKDGKKSLAEAAAAWSRPGMEIRHFTQKEPIDQYAVEKLQDLGVENSNLRYALNIYAKPDQKGSLHPEVLQRTATTDLLVRRGWIIFRVTEIVPQAVPPLAEVREKVAGELLLDRAKEQARTRLTALRKAAEESHQALEEAAKGGKGGEFETALAGPFNEYSWRPPLARTAPGATPPPATDGWKNPERRLTAVMGNYLLLREIPVLGFSDTIDDAEGSGAFYLVQVKGRSDPSFEEMSAAQISSVRKVLARERIQALGSELSYSKLKDRLNLLEDGKPARDPEPVQRRGRR